MSSVAALFWCALGSVQGVFERFGASICIQSIRLDSYPERRYEVRKTAQSSGCAALGARQFASGRSAEAPELSPEQAALPARLAGIVGDGAVQRDVEQRGSRLGRGNAFAVARPGTTHPRNPPHFDRPGGGRNRVITVNSE